MVEIRGREGEQPFSSVIRSFQIYAPTVLVLPASGLPPDAFVNNTATSVLLVRDPDVSLSYAVSYWENTARL